MTDQHPQSPEYDAETNRPAEPTPPAPRRPQRLNPRTASIRRAARNRTHEFELKHTLDEEGQPTTALVRKPALLEADEMRQLPDHIQQGIFKLMEATEAFEGDDDTTQTEAQVRAAARHYGSIADMADGYVLRGFIEPKVYATEEEADANGGVCLADIDMNDRFAFFDFCSGAREQAAETARPFRGEPVVAVDPRPAGETVSGTAEPQPHPAAAGPVRG